MNDRFDPPPTASAVMDSPGLAVSILHYVGVLGRHRGLVAVAVASCLVAACAYLARAGRLYAATARVLVLQRESHPLGTVREDASQGREGVETFLPTQMAILQSPRVVGRAIEMTGPDGLPTLRAAARGAATIAELSRVAAKNFLKVTRPDRTAMIISIEYRAASPGEATRMVDAMVASYQAFLEDHMQSTNSEVVSLITRARDELGRELDALQAKYVEFQRGHPLLIDDESTRSLMNSRLVELDREANECLVRAMRLRSQLDSGRKLAGEGAELWAVAYAISQLGGDPGSTLIPVRSEAPGASSDYARGLGQEQQELAARLGPEYSKVRELRERIAGLREGAGEGPGRADERGVRQLIASIEQGLASVEALRGEIARQVRGDLEESRRMAADLSAKQALRDSMDRLKALFYTVVDQLKRAQLGGDFSSIYARTVEPTNATGDPVHPRVLLTMAMALVAGCVLGTGAALAADGLDARVRTPDDLRAILGLRVLGVVPRLPGELAAAVGVAGMACRDHPRSASAEAYKGIRTGLELLRRDRPLQVLLVTSAVAGEGKSTTASNLAISLAQAGRRVLLVDADLRRPSLHRVFGLRRDAGLVQVLQGLLPPHRAVQRTTIRGLDLAAAGPEVEGHPELLMSRHLAAFIGDARASYDAVIIDSSPLLPVTDAAIVGALADGIVLVARAAVVRRRDASRALDLLRDVETPVLGAVIHGYEPDRDGYGYGEPFGYGPDPGRGRRPDPLDIVPGLVGRVLRGARA